MAYFDYRSDNIISATCPLHLIHLLTCPYVHMATTGAARHHVVTTLIYKESRKWPGNRSESRTRDVIPRNADPANPRNGSRPAGTRQSPRATPMPTRRHGSRRRPRGHHGRRPAAVSPAPRGGPPGARPSAGRKGFIGMASARQASRNRRALARSATGPARAPRSRSRPASPGQRGSRRRPPPRA